MGTRGICRADTWTAEVDPVQKTRICRPFILMGQVALDRGHSLEGSKCPWASWGSEEPDTPRARRVRARWAWDWARGAKSSLCNWFAMLQLLWAEQAVASALWRSRNKMLNALVIIHCICQRCMRVGSCHSDEHDLCGLEHSIWNPRLWKQNLGLRTVKTKLRAVNAQSWTEVWKLETQE